MIENIYIAIVIINILFLDFILLLCLLIGGNNDE